MNLEDLRAAQVDERGTDSLQPLPAAFYEQAADYLADLRRRRAQLAARADDPFDSAEVRQVTDELETAEEVVEALYERRVGKLVKRASLAAAGVPTDETGLTAEEQALFTDLVDRIEAHRASVLDALDGRGDGPRATPPADADVPPAGEDAAPPTPPDGPPDGEPATGADAAPGEETPASSHDGSGATAEADDEPATEGRGATARPTGDAAADEDRVTVRITAEVGEIYGVDDRVYTLGDEDVVTLPTANAEPLLERGAAQRVE